MPRKRDIFSNELAAHETARKKKFTQPRVTAPRLHHQKDWYSDLLKEYPNEKGYV